MKSTPKKNILNNTENIIKDTGSFMIIEFIVSQKTFYFQGYLSYRFLKFLLSIFMHWLKFVVTHHDQLSKIVFCFILFIVGHSPVAHLRGCVGYGRTPLPILSTIFSNVRCPFLPIILFWNHNTLRLLYNFTRFLHEFLK